MSEPTEAGTTAENGKSDTVQELEAIRANRKSLVRVVITYIAATFLFGGGLGLTLLFFSSGDDASAKDLFLAILPVSAAIISFWFAGRKPS